MWIFILVMLFVWHFILRYWPIIMFFVVIVGVYSAINNYINGFEKRNLKNEQEVYVLNKHVDVILRTKNNIGIVQKFDNKLRKIGECSVGDNVLVQVLFSDPKENRGVFVLQIGSGVINKCQRQDKYFIHGKSLRKIDDGYNPY